MPVFFARFRLDEVSFRRGVLKQQQQKKTTLPKIIIIVWELFLFLFFLETSRSSAIIFDYFYCRRYQSRLKISRVISNLSGSFAKEKTVRWVFYRVLEVPSDRLLNLDDWDDLHYFWLWWSLPNDFVPFENGSTNVRWEHSMTFKELSAFFCRRFRRPVACFFFGIKTPNTNSVPSDAIEFCFCFFTEFYRDCAEFKRLFAVQAPFLLAVTGLYCFFFLST